MNYRFSEDLSFFLIDKENLADAPSKKCREKILKRIYEIVATRLPAEQAMIFTHHWKDGESISQIAHETKRTRWYIKQRLLKAAATIRKILEEE